MASVFCLWRLAMQTLAKKTSKSEELAKILDAEKMGSSGFVWWCCFVDLPGLPSFCHGLSWIFPQPRFFLLLVQRLAAIFCSAQHEGLTSLGGVVQSLSNVFSFQFCLFLLWALSYPLLIKVSDTSPRLW